MAGRPIVASRSRWCRSLRGDSLIQTGYQQSDEGRWIEDAGIVTRLLPDDDDESPHQRFILKLANRQTLLIAHNLELAERVPLGLGDRVRFRGTYEWNELGGVVHWTHHDPRGIEAGGWIKYRRTVYA